MTPDLGIARSFVHALTGSPEGLIRLRFVHDRERRALPDVEGTIADLWPAILEAQGNGFAAYYFLNETAPGPGTGYKGAVRDVDVTGVRVLACDCDGGLPDEWELHQPPSIITRTSIKDGVQRGQVLWRAPSGLIPPAEFKQAQRRLAAHYGSDRATVNASRIFRLPGSLHLKREPSLVTFETPPHAGRLDRDPREGLPELPPQAPPSEAVGDPVPLAHLQKLLAYIQPEDRTGWRDLVAAVRNTPAGTEADRLKLLEEKIDPDWHDEAMAIWDTMPPKVGGVGYGSLLFAASKAGYVGQSAAAKPLSERFKVYDPWRSVTDTISEPDEPLVELVPELIEKHICTFLAAPGGMNKSRIALQWGLCIDAGLPIWGRNVEQAQFIYISCEDRPGEVRRRMKTMKRRLKLPDTLTAKWRDFTDDPQPLADIGDDVATTPFYDELKEYLKATPNHKFVVLDSTYDVLRFVGNAKVNETAVHDAIRMLDRLCLECDCTILCLWHPSRSGIERGDASGWSVAWENAPRARLAIEAVKGVKDTYSLGVKKRNNTAPAEPIVVHWSDGVLMPWAMAAADAAKEAFHKVCVDCAIMLWQQGVPVQRQRAVEGTWLWKSIELNSGRRATLREFKMELAEALNAKELRYVSGERGVPTGYAPPLTWTGPTDTTPAPDAENQGEDKW